VYVGSAAPLKGLDVLIGRLQKFWQRPDRSALV